MAAASSASQTTRFAGEAGSVLADAPHQAADAVGRADLRAALAQAEHAVAGLRQAIVADGAPRSSGIGEHAGRADHRGARATY
jgi:hypothetical protein